MATKLEKFAWPGGYTLLYVFTQSKEHLVLCWECATNAQKDEEYNGYNQQGSFIHWEGESLWCDDCGVELPSEYGSTELPPRRLTEKDFPEPQVDAGELACEKTPTIAVDEPTPEEIRHQERLHHENANPER